MKILMLDFFSDISPHSIPIAFVGKFLLDQGNEVDFLSCNGFLESFCVAMANAKLDFNSSKLERKSVCFSCRRRRSNLDKKLGFNSILLDDFVSKDDLLKADNLVNEKSGSELLALELSGIKVGKYATYEMLLKYKLSELKFEGKVLEHFRSQVRNSILVAKSAEKFLSNYKYDLVITNNELYSANNTFLTLCREFGVKTFTMFGGMHADERHNTLTIFQSDVDFQSQSRKASESGAFFKSSSRKGINLAHSHLIGISQGTSAHSYSSAFEKKGAHEVKNILGIKNTHPIALVAMSSEDEVFAAQTIDSIPEFQPELDIFASQYEWISWVASEAASFQDINFVIRLHPRMLPNKREKITAPQLAKFEELFSELPLNVYVDHPKMEISAYDYLNLIDLLLPRNTSLGLEFAAFGIPVVVPGDGSLTAFPPELAYVAHSKEIYKRLILEKIEEKRSFEVAFKTYRWLSFLFDNSVIELLPPKQRQSFFPIKKNTRLRILAANFFAFIYLRFGPLNFDNKFLKTLATSRNELHLLHKFLVAGSNNVHEVKETVPLDISDEISAISNVIIALETYFNVPDHKRIG